MGLFYAYLKAHTDYCGQYLVTFVDREVADEWWRMISTSPSPYAGKVKRVSPQFYVQNDRDKNCVTWFFTNTGLPNAKKFYEKMFFTWIRTGNVDKPIVIPPAEVTDYISGRRYFIRSKSDHLGHWYLRIRGVCQVCGNAHCDVIHVSSEYRTKFCVQVRNPDNDSKELVMIGRDKISITAPGDYVVHSANDGQNLKGIPKGGRTSDLLFDDLKGRFITRAEKQYNGEIWEYVVPVEKGFGEAWELVD